MLISAGVYAQTKPPEPDKTIVSVQLVLSRYEGDRKTSSLPFTMLATADRSQVSIRTGSQVPIVTTSTPTDGKQPAQSFQYIDVGTNVDCNVSPGDSGRFKVIINVQDRSVLERNSPGVRGVPQVATTPMMRNFTYTNSVLLRDGETRQFVTASDKASGETIRIDVTLKVEN